MRHPSSTATATATAPATEPNRPRRVALAGLAALLVAGLSGCVVVNADDGRDRDGMDGMHDDSSASGSVSRGDVMFAQMMIPHHEQAIEMSDLVLEKDGVSPEVVELAEEIKAAQGPEIEQMEEWLDAWDAPAGMHGDHGGMMDGMLTEQEMDELEEADGAAGEELFLEGMIEHHEGAIDMAEQHQQDGENPDALELSASIIETQAAEIARMEELLAG